LRVQAKEVQTLGEAVLLAAGVPREHAALQLELLIEAELRGFPSHGLMRLPTIVKRVAAGLVDPDTRGEHVWRGDALVEVDGENGLGPVVALHALNVVVERAKRTGVAVALLRRANHLGMLAWYVEQAARRGHLAIMTCTAEALVHPWGGSRPMLGTNPVAIGVPAVPDPLVLDMSTSAVSMGKLIDYERRGAPIPHGWAIDSDGRSTTDASAAIAGAISPFGGAKGYALGLALEVLVASLTHTSLGTDVVGTLDTVSPSSKGDVIIAFGEQDGSTITRTGDYLEQVRRCPTDVDGSVGVPGDRSRTARDSALSDGFELADSTAEELQVLHQDAMTSSARDRVSRT